MRKPETRSAIREMYFECDEISDPWAQICRLEKEKDEERKWQKEEELDAQIKLEDLKLQQARVGNRDSSVVQGGAVKMFNLVQPFISGDNIGLYLVNFERLCERYSFNRDKWTQWFLSLLPGEASQVMARSSSGEAVGDNLVKSSLLAKYRFSTGEFRRRFRQEEKKSNESIVKFACGLRDNLTEWVKGSDADVDFCKLKGLICLERFYETLPERIRLCDKDRQFGISVNKAAQLVDGYVESRSFKESKVSQDARHDYLRKGNHHPPAPQNRFMEAESRQPGRKKRYRKQCSKIRKSIERFRGQATYHVL